MRQQQTVAASLYKVAGTTQNEIHKELLIVQRNPQAAIKVAETEFGIERVTDVSEVSDLVWTPRSL